MLHLKTLLCALLIICCGSRVDAHDNSKLWNSLVQGVRETDFSGVSEQKIVQLLLDVAEACHVMERLELAGEFTNQALEISDKLPDGNLRSRVFDTALKTGQLDLAGKIANEQEVNQLRMLDRLAVARFKSGDEDAIKDYPQNRLDYHNAVELAMAYGEVGEFEKMEAFVRSIDSLPSNEPSDVGVFAFKQLAMSRFTEGDVAGAKKFIAIAMELGGTNYYTGYSVNVANNSIHGKLTVGLENLAERGAAYGGHHARQLLATLVVELVRTGHDTEAIKIVDFFEDKPYAFGVIARQQAERGDFKKALATVKKSTPKNQFRLNVRVAELQWLAGEKNQARKQIAIAEQLIANDTDLQIDLDYDLLAKFYGLIQSESDVQRFIDKAEMPYSKAARMASAMQGIANARNRSE